MRLALGSCLMMRRGSRKRIKLKKKSCKNLGVRRAWTLGKERLRKATSDDSHIEFHLPLQADQTAAPSSQPEQQAQVATLAFSGGPFAVQLGQNHGSTTYIRKIFGKSPKSNLTCHQTEATHFNTHIEHEHYIKSGPSLSWRPSSDS